MNQKSTIDSIFKNGLQGMEPPGADDGWQRLEQPLAEQNQAQERGRKRRVAAWLLGMVALLGGGALLWTNLYNGTGVDKAKPYANNAPVSAAPSTTPVAAKEPQPEQPAQAPTVMDKRMADTDAGDRMRPASARPMVVQQDGTARFRLGDAVAAGADDSQQKTARKTVRRLQQKGRQRLAIKPAETGSETVAATTEIPTQPDIGAAIEQAAAPPNETTTATDPAVPPSETTTATDPAAPQQPTVANETPPTPKQPATASTADRQKKQAKSPVQIELAAGIDISTGLGNPGKYAAMMVRLPLNKKANLLTGIGFATNRLTTGYTRADKQNLLNSPIDATLRGLTMLQFPLLYEQPIKEQKLLLRAGLMPIYILDASIVNVSNGFTGNPNNFRTFTLGDIHRFNVLFSAGLHYRFTPRLGIELRANYGLTELVKNSYINQSGENNNLKSAQVGLLLMLGRKR